MQNPVHVQSFVAVVELSSFTRAAQRLNITQAAVSQHVRALEERLGPLLVRRPRHLTVTPAGAALLVYAETLRNAESRLQLEVADGEALGDISVITPGSVGLLLYPLLLDYQMAHPGIVILHRFAPDDDVEAAILDNRAHIGLMSRRPDDPRIKAAAFAEEPLELVIPAGADARTWGDLERLGYIDHPDGQAMMARLLSRRFSGFQGVRHLPVRGFSNQIGLILEPVSRGLGFAVLPRYARQAFPRQHDIAVVGGHPVITDTLWLVHRAEWPLPKRIDRLVSALPKRLGLSATGR